MNSLQRTFAAAFVVFLGLAGISLSQVRERPKALRYVTRYGYDANLRLYAQKTPKEAMESIVRVLSDERFDYLMAHLADPEYVDGKVAVYKQDYPAGNDDGKSLLAFQRLVRETTKNFFQDAELFRELRRFAREAEWEVTEDQAIGNVKELLGRQVVLRRLEGRWFLKNR